MADGIDPNEARKEEKATKEAATINTFGRIAEEWFEAWSEGKAAVTVRHVRDRLDHFILPFLASKSVAEIKAADVLECLRPFEAKGITETRNIPLIGNRLASEPAEYQMHGIAIILEMLGKYPKIST